MYEETTIRKVTIGNITENTGQRKKKRIKERKKKRERKKERKKKELGGR